MEDGPAGETLCNSMGQRGVWESSFVLDTRVEDTVLHLFHLHALARQLPRHHLLISSEIRDVLLGVLCAQTVACASSVQRIEPGRHMQQMWQAETARQIAAPPRVTVETE